MRRALVVCGLTALAILTYLPFVGLPPMQDDYLQVELAERYGGPTGWADLLRDPLYRCRATSILVTAATVQLLGWSNLAFHVTGLVLHALNALLIAMGAALTAGYFLLAYGQRAEHQHFNDGTFSFRAHLVRTILNSAARGLWIWGGLSLAAVATYRPRVNWRLFSFGAAWFLAGLLPYSFLTYMPRIPSRHHYVASVGMALIVSLAFWAFIQGRRRGPWIATALACAFIAHNWGYLWISKKPQFEWRASLIEDFVTFVAEAPESHVVNACRDLNSAEAQKAIHYRLGLSAETLIPASEEAGARVYHCAPPPGS